MLIFILFGVAYFRTLLCSNWGGRARLNVRAPSIQLKVTEHTDHIVDFIGKIVEKEHAYARNDGV